jgi:acetylornithine/succinyldiaminopimelate/putrescine aminotransferase
MIQRPRIVRAANDLLFAQDGQRYIDLFTAHGTVFLGHARAEIARALQSQLDAVWITGGLETPACDRARAEIEALFPPSHGLAALYSTGMEAAEFAMRLARAATQRPGVVGFADSMHGKSLATARLGWDNRGGVRTPDIHRLPFVGTASESEILDRLRATLREGSIGAVFVEPLQGSGAGRMASADFYRAVALLCGEQGALLVFDELLTGLHRTGPAFLHPEFGVQPDVVLIGKALGNGFPVSAVVADRRIELTRAMLPGSTYAGNALACAAAGATLELMRALDVPARVRRIEQIMARTLAPIAQAGITLRGRGAIWFVELDSEQRAERAVVRSYRSGVCVGFAGRQIRLLPAATIEPEHLERACAAVTGAVLDADGHAAS